MSNRKPRFRMFAGPNGSGKSTLKRGMPEEMVGQYINPDDMEVDLRRDGHFDAGAMGLTADQEEFRSYYLEHGLVTSKGLQRDADFIDVEDNRVSFGDRPIGSYHAAVISSFVIDKLIEQKKDISMETVMSSESKIDLLRKARTNGFSTVLYYVSTESPDINVERVRDRKYNGGHDVEEVLIRQRYSKSMGLLPDAIKQSEKAFLFDNSGMENSYVMRIDGRGTRVVESVDEPPHWVEAVAEGLGLDPYGAGVTRIVPEEDMDGVPGEINLNGMGARMAKIEDKAPAQHGGPSSSPSP